MKFTAVAIVSAAVAVSAHPGGNEHRSIHQARSDFVMAKKPDVPAPAVAVPSAVPSAPVAALPQTNAPLAGGFCGNTKRATLAQIAYKGNTGTGEYGCNIIGISPSAIGSYDYTMNFINHSGSSKVCYCWNKVGPDGGLNGFFKGNQALTFNLPTGASQPVAVDKNSQGGCACGVGGVPTTSYGEFASTWVEFDFANASNGGWSGADASCLVSAANHLDIPALSVCYNGQCSTIYAGGSGSNAYTAGTENADGIGLNIPPGRAALTVTVG